MTRKAYVNNAPDLSNEQKNDAFVRALDQQLARIPLKKIAEHKLIALEPQHSYAQLEEKLQQEDITRTHIDRHKVNKNSTLSSSINNLSREIDHLTVDYIHTMEQDIAHGINVVRHRYSNDPILKRKHSS